MDVARAPVIYVIGGPNGAGKTTFAREFLPAEGIFEFLNADLIAAGLAPLQPEAMAIRAARLLLSGRTYAGMLREAKRAGYVVIICYLWLPDARFSLRRVRERVRKGGHDVPAMDVRRRFLPSLRNFFTLYLPLADDALLFLAAHLPPRLVASWKEGNVVILSSKAYACIQRQAAFAEAN